MNKLVTVITPTTHDRAEFNKINAILIGIQDFPFIEHLFDFDNGVVGEKRNRLCDRAKGEIIIHADSDDWYANDWVSRSVSALVTSGVGLVGLSTATFHSPSLNRSWQYIYPPTENLIGATLCYYKSFWEQNKFQNIDVGEDYAFVRGSRFKAHDYIKGFMATVHEGNTSPKNISGERWAEIG